MEEKAKGMSVWLRVVLVISLALNLLVAGAVVGSVAKWGGKHGGPHARFEQMGGPLTRALAPKDKIMILREIRKVLRDSDGGREEKRAHFRALLNDLRADSFDREAVAGHLARQRRFIDDRMALGQRVLLDRLAGMSAAERAEFANRLEENLRRDGG